MTSADLEHNDAAEALAALAGSAMMDDAAEGSESGERLCNPAKLILKH